jgi:hypothetical protein
MDAEIVEIGGIHETNTILGEVVLCKAFHLLVNCDSFEDVDTDELAVHAQDWILYLCARIDEIENTIRQCSMRAALKHQEFECYMKQHDACTDGKKGNTDPRYIDRLSVQLLRTLGECERNSQVLARLAKHEAMLAVALCLFSLLYMEKSKNVSLLESIRSPCFMWTTEVCEKLMPWFVTAQSNLARIGNTDNSCSARDLFISTRVFTGYFLLRLAVRFEAKICSCMYASLAFAPFYAKIFSKFTVMFPSGSLLRMCKKNFSLARACLDRMRRLQPSDVHVESARPEWLFASDSVGKTNTGGSGLQIPGRSSSSSGGGSGSGGSEYATQHEQLLVAERVFGSDKLACLRGLFFVCGCTPDMGSNELEISQIMNLWCNVVPIQTWKHSGDIFEKFNAPVISHSSPSSMTSSVVSEQQPIEDLMSIHSLVFNPVEFIDTVTNTQSFVYSRPLRRHGHVFPFVLEKRDPAAGHTSTLGWMFMAIPDASRSCVQFLHSDYPRKNMTNFAEHPVLFFCSLTRRRNFDEYGMPRHDDNLANVSRQAMVRFWEQEVTNRHDSLTEFLMQRQGYGAMAEHFVPVEFDNVTLAASMACMYAETHYTNIENMFRAGLNHAAMHSVVSCLEQNPMRFFEKQTGGKKYKYSALTNCLEEIKHGFTCPPNMFDALLRASYKTIPQALQ